MDQIKEHSDSDSDSDSVLQLGSAVTNGPKPSRSHSLFLLLHYILSRIMLYELCHCANVLWQALTYF